MPPRWATPRDPSRPTDGADGAFLAHLRGRPWLPHQRATADLVGERLPNGRYAYPIVIVLWPRQCGKTTWAFDLAEGRCLAQADYRAAYTAQTGQITSERFRERMGELGDTALGRRVKMRQSQGTERMTYGRGSYVKAFPPKDGALRGSALDLVVVDEPQQIDEDLGLALDRTILPTFTTRPRRQMILVGTAGDDLSRYLARYVAMARAGAAGVALIEYGAEPDEDPADPAVWHRRHPGLAAGLTDTDALRDAFNVLGAAGFAQEYLTVWQSNADRTIPAAAWAAIRHRDAKPADSVPPVIGVDVAVDRTGASVVACWPDQQGVPTVELVAYRPGVDWVAAEVARLHTAHRAQVWIDGGTGPASTVAADPLLAGRDWLHPVTPREYTAACASMFDHIGAGSVAHRGDKALDAAAAGAVRRTVGDGWAWARRTSTADVSPLVAASLAVHGHLHRPATTRPRIVTLD